VRIKLDHITLPRAKGSIDAGARALACAHQITAELAAIVSRWPNGQSSRKGLHTMRYGLLWLLGIPIPVLLLLWFFNVL
jgi:hypothetical protein